MAGTGGVVAATVAAGVVVGATEGRGRTIGVVDGRGGGGVLARAGVSGVLGAIRGVDTGEGVADVAGPIGKLVKGLAVMAAWGGTVAAGAGVLPDQTGVAGFTAEDGAGVAAALLFRSSR